MKFGLRLTSKAKNDLDNFNDQISDQLKKEILTLLDDPKRGDKKGGSLKNFRAFKQKTDRRASYRIGYALIRVNDEPWISVIQIGKREGFYDEMKRRAKSFRAEEFL